MHDNLDSGKRRRGLVLSETDDCVIYGCFPTRDGGPLGVFTWDVKPRQFGEDWQTFVARAATETLSWVERVNLEKRLSPLLARSLFYNVAFLPETNEAARRDV